MDWLYLLYLRYRETLLLMCRTIRDWKRPYPFYYLHIDICYQALFWTIWGTIFQTNPPFYAPLVELVPSPWVDADVVPTTKAIMDKIGQVPVVLKREIDGFVLNRIQYSIMKEAWSLITVKPFSAIYRVFGFDYI